MTTFHKYQHVVFADAVSAGLRPINFSVTPPADEPVASESLCAEDDRLVRWLFREAGIDHRAYRAESLARRVPACLRILRANSAAEARSMLKRKPDLNPLALGTILLGVTSFFRDAPVFDALRHRILPRLLFRRSGMRVWSAGCSEGHELYSIAMLLQEQGALQASTLLGTDCRVEAVQTAQRGAYDESAVRSVPLDMLQHFQVSAEGWHVRTDLRRHVHFQVADLLCGDQNRQWDLILCRNVAMYLTERAAMDLWRRLWESLSPGGVLVTGKAERPQARTDLVCVAPSIYARAEF